MKLNNISKIFIAAALTVSLSSCDDYLNLDNPNNITTSTFWQDLDDVQSGLNATYATLRKEAILNIRFEALRADLAWPSAERPGGIAEADNWYNQEYSNSTPAVIAKWDALYVGVWRANQVIEALQRLENNSEIESERWVNQMAQARFLRGLFYFYLHSAYNGGSVVLKQKTPENPDEFHQPLSPSADVLKFFRADLQYAVDNLPAKRADQTQTTPVKATAQTILGTSYLYEKEFAEAQDLFKSVIEDGPFKLETDLDRMFTQAGEFNSESIFEIAYSRELRPELGVWDGNAMTSPLATFSKSWFVPSSWISEAYINEKPDAKQTVNKEKNAAGVARSVSLRASSMVALITDCFTPYYMTGNAAEQTALFGGPNAAKSFARYKKYQNHDTMEREDASLSGRNVTVNRLSDVYLMYAECILETSGNINQALYYINEVRKRWSLELLGNGIDVTRTYNGVSYTYESLMEHLMFVERPLELSTEGHQIRWQDLRRWGLLEEDDRNIFKKRSGETFYAYKPFPLPTRIDGTAIPATTIPNFSTVEATWPLNSVGVPMVSSGVVVIDYEYDQSYRNYSKKNNAYLPIPSTEISNNSKI